MKTTTNYENSESPLPCPYLARTLSVCLCHLVYSMDKRELFEVKDDEEQRAKLQDICDLLLAAGYFRVRLKGLSAFDKVVGGMVWCLELCAVDVDVNFLFRENLNIGEKIEITEKIINVLLSIKCAYALEPHQIQGLDTVKILPVMQWLVKKAMETRESLNDHLREIADLQYQKTFPLPESEVKLQETAKNLPKLFLPQRKFKKVQGQSLPIEKEVVSTLMEYGYNKVNLLDDTQQLVEKTMKSEKKLENRAIAHKVSNLIHQQAGFISQTIDDYTQRQNEREGERDERTHLEERNKKTSEALERVCNQIASQQQVMDQLKAKIGDLIASEEVLEQQKKSLAALETEENRQTLDQLDRLVSQNEAANAQRKQFKNQCKTELEELQSRNEALLSKEEEAPANQDHLKRQVDSAREQLAGALKILGEKNVNLMKLRRQLDAVPGNSELNQYQRRFTELCTQVNEKQTELNGYYLLYNTLEDTKVYLNKELSLLTSIHDSFSQSMTSSAGKGEFLQQMEKIVTAVRQNKNKIEKQIEMLTEKHHDLGRCLGQFAVEEHQYRDTLKAISHESHKYKQLMSQLSDHND
ncbi:coiled-coil domain-containing protein 93-like isoform X1 [Daphnia pulex]|uniref:coiled-coil domain-containing protein 93-like isoform X1 n=1 Tax=Daphnia pulex TaxID=6669 RepID=UPI001EDE1DAF|nr:coiled-coil domain-containing protein 93-like isoform X1 [Daphnia pulex]